MPFHTNISLSMTRFQPSYSNWCATKMTLLYVATCYKLF
jgi:hypothetical protein